MKDTRHVNHLQKMEKRKVILAALSKATEDVLTPDGNTVEDNNVTGEYYTLTQEEVAALVNGDIEKIENWVNSLDRRRAAWLLQWLIKDNW